MKMKKVDMCGDAGPLFFQYWYFIFFIQKRVSTYHCPQCFSSVQSLSHVWLCNPIDCSTPGLPVHHQLPQLTQTHVHCTGDAIQPSHLLSSPSPLGFNLSQHQGLFQWVSSSYQVAKDWSFSFSISPSNEHSGLICFRIDWFHLVLVQWTLRVLSNPTVQNHKFFCSQLSL